MSLSSSGVSVTLSFIDIHGNKVEINGFNQVMGMAFQDAFDKLQLHPKFIELCSSSMYADFKIDGSYLIQTTCQ